MERPRPQPDQFQPRRDAGDSLRGLPKRQPDQTPQSGGSKSPERDRRDQAGEAPPAHQGLEKTPVLQPTPGEQKGFDRSKLIAEIEKRVQRLIQPDIGVCTVFVFMPYWA